MNNQEYPTEFFVECLVESMWESAVNSNRLTQCKCIRRKCAVRQTVFMRANNMTEPKPFCKTHFKELIAQSPQFAQTKTIDIESVSTSSDSRRNSNTMLLNLKKRLDS
jgi:hypothetical protein